MFYQNRAFAPYRMHRMLTYKADNKFKKEGEAVVELDQFKSTLLTYEKPLVEVRDSL